MSEDLSVKSERLLKDALDVLLQVRTDAVLHHVLKEHLDDTANEITAHLGALKEWARTEKLYQMLEDPNLVKYVSKY